MTHCKSHKVAYFSSTRESERLCGLKEAPCVRLQKQCDKNKMPPFPRPRVGFSTCTRADADHSGFQTSQVIINAHFPPADRLPMLVLSKEKRFNMLAVEAKGKTGGTDSNLFQPPRRPLMGPTAVCELFLRSLRWAPARARAHGPGRLLPQKRRTLLISLVCV